MNWERIKTVLIVLFVVLNVVLLGLLYEQQRQSSAQAQETIAAVEKVLEKNNITIEMGAIWEKDTKMKNITLVNTIGTYQEFAARLLGEGFLETGENVYEKDGAYLALKGNTFTLRERAIEGKSAREYLKERGFNLKYAHEKETEHGEHIFFQKYEGYEILQSRMTFEQKDGFVSVSGMWLSPKKEMGAKHEIKPLTAVLPYLVRDKKNGEEMHITEISLGYREIMPQGNDVFYSEITAVPVWQIKTKEGKTFYYDAEK